MLRGGRLQAAPRLGVQAGRERALLGDRHVGGQVIDTGRADDRAGQGRVAEREPEHELDRAHAVEQVGHAGGLPAALAHSLAEAERPVAPGLVFGRGAARGAAADQRPGAGRGGRRDQVLMLALHRRVRDLEDVETELILSDLVVVEKRLERLEKDRKKIKSPELDREYELLVKCKAELEANRPLRNLEIELADEKLIRGFQFLSQKPMLFVLNIGEEDAGRLHEIEEEYRKGPLAGRTNTAVTAICGKIEAELAELARAWPAAGCRLVPSEPGHTGR